MLMNMIDLPLSQHALTNGRLSLGQDGLEEWVCNLPARVERICQQWSLQPLRSLEAGTRGLVLLCQAPGQQVVLKIPFDGAELEREHQALMAWHAAGSESVVNVAAYKPGYMATSFVRGRVGAQEPGIYKPTAFFAFEKGLHVPSSHSLQSVTDNVLGRLERASARLPGLAGRIQLTAQHMQAAIDRVHALDASTAHRVLVHGDLGGGNLFVTDGGRLVACDPKGMIGDAYYDLAMWCLFCERKGDISWKERCAGAGFDVPRIEAWQPVIAVHELIAYMHNDKGHESWDAFNTYAARLIPS